MAENNSLGHLGECSEQFLFDEKLLKSINFDDSQKRLDISVSPSNLGENFIMRPLSLHDYCKGYIELLAQLTKVGDITEEKYGKRFREMKECPNTYYIAVIENTKEGKIVAAASLVLEQKFIHEIAMRGRIEEVVVHTKCRGKHFGKVLVESLTLLAKNLGCYKISLDCNEALVPYYNKFGYKKEDVHFLVNRFYN
ncbi:glucosamine 6-phosphate N-acetyltransferase-like [Dendronephthya gigantea]|uniref:glucosamine 6-phosphate N-acetyltransferase-like n=1 Tax=Dendronephthya gigantea TaxID=151771 RepID=UPI00106DAF4F|nr:glucosamine 6-phosphate N-acetyltransferase-like [Dendronephthya gigantea]